MLATVPVGALAGATGQALDNVANGQPWDQNLGRSAVLGAALGLLFGAADAELHPVAFSTAGWVARA